MSKIVFHSSVVLALLRGEPVSEPAANLLTQARMSTVNLSEVLSKIADLQSTDLESSFASMENVLEILPFTESQARIAASLRSVTRSHGLSFGDRACLALALEGKADVYTTDRAWVQLDLPCRVHLLR